MLVLSFFFLGVHISVLVLRGVAFAIEQDCARVDGARVYSHR